MRRILAGVVFSLMLTGGAAAGPLEEGFAAYDRGDYATALRLFRPLAEQGDADAQYNLGISTPWLRACRRTTFRRICGSISPRGIRRAWSVTTWVIIVTSSRPI